MPSDAIQPQKTIRRGPLSILLDLSNAPKPVESKITLDSGISETGKPFFASNAKAWLFGIPIVDTAGGGKAESKPRLAGKKAIQEHSGSGSGQVGRIALEAEGVPSSWRREGADATFKVSGSKVERSHKNVRCFRSW